MIITNENYKSAAIGAKAEKLFIMQENGFNIPPFFCVWGNCDAQRYAEKIFKCGVVSVRSSASSEDGNTASFAGQFTTELNVPINGINAAVKRVRSVPETDGFKEYCKSNGIAPEKISICAIVQEMIEAELSGVIFTANPAGLLNETVVVIGKGTGNNIVEDKVPATTYYCCSDGNYYSESTENSPLIPEKALRKILAEADRIKSLFGCDCDIEFAMKSDKIYILQARPITTLNACEQIILDNSNIAESYPGITLPLTQSFIRTAYYRVFKNVLLRLTHEPRTVKRIDKTLRNMVDSANGRIYYRISNWYDVILFLPFSKKIIPVWQEMLGVKNKKVSSKIAGHIGFLTHVKVFFSFMYLIVSCPKLMRKLSAEFEDMIRFFKSVDIDKISSEEILIHYKNVLDKVTEKWDLTLVNDMYSFIFTGLLKAWLKAKKVKDADGMANSLISGINGIASMRPITSLVDIAAMAKSCGELEKISEIHSSEDFTAYLKGGGKFARMLTEYIEIYGDRGPEELKLESRTFRTNPELLCMKIAECSENGVNVKVSAKKNSLHGVCGILARKAALGIKNREKSRLDRTRLYGMMRSMMLRVGTELAKNKQIDKPRDIFYLKYGEIEKAVLDGENFSKTVNERRELYRRFELLPAYSRLVFAGRVFDKAPHDICGMENVEADVLHGTPCSNGKVRGELLVVTDPDSCPDTRGKIIVAQMTDPGWVFIIAGAAGLISEKGSLLSHTAIISRELKKPCVVGVENAFRLLRSGDIAELDGTSGTIKIIGRNSQ